MSLPYAGAEAGPNARVEAERVLRELGVKRIATMQDDNAGVVGLQFYLKGRAYEVRMTYKGYEELLRRSGSRSKKPPAEQARIAVWSAIRDVVKGAATLIACRFDTIEGAFMDHALLPTGETVKEALTAGRPLPALPPPSE